MNNFQGILENIKLAYQGYLKSYQTTKKLGTNRSKQFGTVQLSS